MRLRFCGLIALILASSCALRAQPTFSVTYPVGAYHGPFTGRVVIYLTKSDVKPGPFMKADEPRFGPDWFNPQPMYSAAFSNVMPGQPMIVSDANATGYPGKISALPEGDYKVQAVVDRNLGGRQIGDSPGNLYSAVSTIHLSGSISRTVTLACEHVVQEPEFKETPHVKLMKLQSALLTKWYHRPTFMMAAVVLPDAWLTDGNRKFPIEYDVPGFGGSYMDLSGRDQAYKATMMEDVPFILVHLDPNVPTGHCVLADSANNGPWGEALTTEFIPALEQKFRAIGTMATRYVGGHSSGGWSSLWLQIAYPDVFGGVWSTSPDPVDFHKFQLIDIYKTGANLFTDDKGNPIPLAREGDKPFIYTKPFSDMERPIRGEQLGSFEAVFSPRDKDGEPEKLWNRDTGAIDSSVAEAWKKYDIALKLRKEWPTLGPKLKGKLHIFCGDIDTFYLDGAVRLLKAELADLGSDAEVEIVPGDHFSMMTQSLWQKMTHEMVEKFKSAKSKQ